MIRSIPLLIAFSLAGCASLLFDARIQPSRTVIDPSRRERVWAAAGEELARRGFEIVRSDPARGVLRTAATVQPGRVKCGWVTCRHRKTVEVLVAPDASVSVSLKQELAAITTLPLPGFFFFDESWKAPTRWEREAIERIEAEQDELLRAITER